MPSPAITIIADPENWRTQLRAQVPKIAGIYVISNTLNGKSYVGSSVNIRNRWRDHLVWLFESKGSGSKPLRRAWEKYGSSSFEFKILEVVAANCQLLDREQHWIDALGSFKFGYNVRPRAASNLGIVFGPHSEETRRKIGKANSIALKGRPSGRKGEKKPETAKIKQSRTRRDRGRKITLNGRSQCLADWADEISIPIRALQNRLTRGWPLTRAFTEPSRGY